MPTKTEYREYISSDHWKRRRKDFLTHFPSCNRCRLNRTLALIAYDQDLHVHHRSYARVGAELDDDLEALCKRCHEVETFGRSNLHVIVGSNGPKFYADLFRDLGPQMIMSLGEGYESTVRQYVGGSLEMAEHVICVLIKYLRQCGATESNIDDFTLEILFESKRLADEDWRPFENEP
jgi:hypothetical protein